MDQRKYHILALMRGLAVTACSGQSSPDRVAVTPPTSQSAAVKAPNFIVLIGDDMSVETLSCYSVGTPAVTPHLDRLCAQSKRFDNFWAQPVCSPTRASILSGRYGFRTGVGTPATSKIAAMPIPEAPAFATKELNEGSPRPPAGLTAPAPGLRADEFTLPMALKSGSKIKYETAAFGKWHLADPTNGGKDHPNLAGFDYYHGPVRGGGNASYFAWSEVINGEITQGTTGWADSAKVDDALAWIDTRESDKPYLLWMAFNAPHTPFHLPPTELLNSEAKNLDPNGITLDNQHAYYYAMIEALDTEIGRLLANIPKDELDNSYVIFVGDNGTPEQVATAPFDFDNAKGSLSQGGLNVPFFVSGPGITNGQTGALANSVDIYATLMDLAGLDPTVDLPSDKVFDTVSLVPVLEDQSAKVRDYAYADVFGVVPRGIVSERTIRDDRYKLFVDTKGEESLFDLNTDPYEKTNLLKEGGLSTGAQGHYDTLKTSLNNLVKSK